MAPDIPNAGIHLTPFPFPSLYISHLSPTSLFLALLSLRKNNDWGAERWKLFPRHSPSCLLASSRRAKKGWTVWVTDWLKERDFCWPPPWHYLDMWLSQMEGKKKTMFLLFFFFLCVSSLYVCVCVVTSWGCQSAFFREKITATSMLIFSPPLSPVGNGGQKNPCNNFLPRNVIFLASHQRMYLYGTPSSCHQFGQKKDVERVNSDKWQLTANLSQIRSRLRKEQKIDQCNNFLPLPTYISLIGVFLFLS